MPVAGNITQSLYFVFGVLSYFGFSILLSNPRVFLAIKQGVFAWATLHVAMGFIDLFAKLAGSGDVMAPIRSVSYAMLTEVQVSGFWRIAGAYAEASSFGAASVILLAFMFAYWRDTRSALALVLCSLLITIVVFSTSTTAYVAGAILVTLLFISAVFAALCDRLRTHQVWLLVAAAAACTALLGIAICDETALVPMRHLLDTMIFEKASSASGLERAYWNVRSWESIIDTSGLGIGLGSSRTSSWIIAVISQLGIIGTALMAILTLELFRFGDLRRVWDLDRESRSVTRGLRAASFALLITISISGGGADPGIVFYLTLAVVTWLRGRCVVREADRYPINCSWPAAR